MAVQHPIAGIVGDKFDVARLRYTHEHRVSRAPRRLRLSSSFCARDDKLTAMKMDRMVVHAEVAQAKPYTLPLPHNQGSRLASRFAVAREPVELQIHGVSDRDTAQD